MEALGNVAFLERPFHPTTLVSVVKLQYALGDDNTKRVQGSRSCAQLRSNFAP